MSAGQWIALGIFAFDICAMVLLEYYDLPDWMTFDIY